MNAIDLSQTMRGLANMRLGSRLLVQALVHRAATILDTFNPQVWPTHCQPALLLLTCWKKKKKKEEVLPLGFDELLYPGAARRFVSNVFGFQHDSATAAHMADMRSILARFGHVSSEQRQVFCLVGLMPG